MSSKYNFPAPQSAIAQDVYDQHIFAMWICLAIFIAVFGVMFYSILKNIKYNLQAAFVPHRRVKLIPRFQHRFVGDPDSDAFDNDTQYNPSAPKDEAAPRTGYRQDISAWLTISARPIDPLRLRSRVRYQNFSIDDNVNLEQSLWSYSRPAT